MARLIRPMRRTLLSRNSIPQHEPEIHTKPLFVFTQSTSSLNPNHSATKFQQQRNYISEMRKSAFNGNILRLLRNEINYELESFPPTQPASKFGSFTIEDRAGEQWIRMKGKYGDNEDIKIESTMFDGSVSAPGSIGGVPTEGVHLHITLMVNITKGDDDVLEIMCSAWPDTIEITKFFIRQQDKIPALAQPYVGPEFKELDDELQNTLYNFLEERGITDDLAVFLHAYMKNKEKTEFVNWMKTVKKYIQKS